MKKDIKNNCGLNINKRKGPLYSLPPKDFSQIPGNNPCKTAIIRYKARIKLMNFTIFLLNRDIIRGDMLCYFFDNEEFYKYNSIFYCK